MGTRAIIELIEELALCGGGFGLFTGCAAGDTAMAVVLEVGDADDSSRSAGAAWTFADWIADNAARTPDKVSLALPRRDASYAALARRVEKSPPRSRRRGSARGACVAWLGLNSPTCSRRCSPAPDWARSSCR